MKISVLIYIMMLLTPNANARPIDDIDLFQKPAPVKPVSIVEYREKLAQYSTDLEKQRAKGSDKNLEMKKLEGELKAAGLAFDRAKGEWDESASFPGLGWTGFRAKGDPTLRKTMDAAQVKVDNLQAALALAEEDSLELQKDISNLNSSFKAQDKELNDLVSGLRTELQANRLVDNFSYLGSKISDLDLKLNEMNRIYDQSRIGAYIKDKMGQLLNSESMCEAVNSCKSGGSAKVDGNRFANELFPNTSGSTRKGSYKNITPSGDSKAKTQ